MAKSKRSREPVVLPPVGSVFLMPLADGRFGACWVIRHDAEMSGIRFGMTRALVSVSRWIGTAVPTLQEPLLRAPLILNHHSWKNQVEAFYAIDNVPETFRLLGTIVPTSEEMRLECLSSTGWASAALQLLLQWRWDNDRDALLAEEELNRQREKAMVLEKQNNGRLTWRHSRWMP